MRTNNLKMIRKANRMSQSTLANLLNKTQPSISALETGAAMNTEDLMKICEIFSVTPNELMDVDNPDLLLKIGNFEAKKNNRINKLRLDKQLSQTDLANILGVTRAAVSSWEMRIVTPNQENIRMLCELFSVTPAELYSTRGQFNNTSGLSNPLPFNNLHCPSLIDSSGDVMEITPDEEMFLIKSLLKYRNKPSGSNTQPIQVRQQQQNENGQQQQQLIFG
ncbi:MAG: helix-turn-helix domain-containing protein [Turicibacter sp.]|nr:helix-turn-helix domain-containing protein [Turicibacter sp.]